MLVPPHSLVRSLARQEHKSPIARTSWQHGLTAPHTLKEGWQPSRDGQVECTSHDVIDEISPVDPHMSFSASCAERWLAKLATVQVRRYRRRARARTRPRSNIVSAWGLPLCYDTAAGAARAVQERRAFRVAVVRRAAAFDRQPAPKAKSGQPSSQPLSHPTNKPRGRVKAIEHHTLAQNIR